ncbi:MULTISPECIES: hypothetical protein [Lachnospiraceae]|uniref:hypothetical protein n=2 Tax=Lachnospirales TaxID=3085636 RepID=UPI0028A25E18|nr:MULTISPECIES: hypothetical protein [Lachnospiraceae]
MDKKKAIIIKFEEQKLYFLKEGSVYYYHCGNFDSVSSKPSISIIATLSIIGTIIIRQLQYLTIFLNNLIARFALIIILIVVIYFLVNFYIHKNMRYPEVSNADIYWKSENYLEVLRSTYKGNSIIDITMIFTGIFCIIFSTVFLFSGNLVALALNLVVSFTFILLVKAIRIKYEVSGTDLVFNYRITRKLLKKLKKEGMF